MTEYEAIREKAAAQKRDIERALTKFAAKTSDTQTLFLTDDKEYMRKFLHSLYHSIYDDYWDILLGVADKLYMYPYGMMKTL